MTAGGPPPGWEKKVRLMQAIIDRAEAQRAVASLHGGPTLIHEQKLKIAYAHMAELMAMRPPVPVRTVQVAPRARAMFEDLERQITAEATRQRAIRTSNDNAVGASQQQGKRTHG